MMTSSWQLLVLLTFCMVPAVLNVDWCPSECTCYRHLTTTDCSGRHLPTIPSIPSSTTHLYIENNHIEHLMALEFYASPNLIVLTLHGNQLTLLDSCAFEGLDILQELNLSRNQLVLLRITSTENATLPSLQELDLSGNQLQTMPHNLSAFSPNLKVLNLSHNWISSAWIDPTYRSLNSLQRIDLTGNPLHQIASFHLNPLKHGPLEVLKLSDCGLHFINESAFEGLNNLTSLSLAHNPINMTDLPNILSGLSGRTPLAFLDLSGNSLPEITPEILHHLSQLQILDLSNSTIRWIDSDVFPHLYSLHTLELQDNFITRLDHLSSLLYLRRLNLRNNMISQISLAKLFNLQFVDLSFNHIEEIPSNWLAEIDGLHIINLSHNNLKHISPLAFQKVTLNHLDLSHNQLTVLHSFGMLKLSMLILSHNKLQTITDDAFVHLQETMEELDLSFNAFNHLPDHKCEDFKAIQRLNLANNDFGLVLGSGGNSHIFYCLRDLQVLDLSFNNITSLSHEHTTYLHQLTTLNLQGNRVNQLSDIGFVDLTSLSKLDLSKNLLHTVDTQLLSELQYLETIDLRSNPFQCTCDLIDFVLWINTTSVRVLGLDDQRQYQCTMAATQRTQELMTYHPLQRQCLTKHHNIKEDLTIFGFIVCALVGFTIITALLINYGSICQRIKSLHYRWQIRYREVSDIEALNDPKL